MSQDPHENPRLKVGTIVGEPLENFGIASGKEKDERVARLQRVGMRPDAMNRFTHEFRRPAPALGIAKALAVNLT